MPDTPPASGEGEEPSSDVEWETLRTAPATGPPQPAALADFFPQLEVEGLLGEGGMGWVYKARQKGLDRPVALKLLPRHISAEQDFAERFAREARALAKLSHPGIVTIHDSGEVDGLYYFVMEFVEGVNLRELINRSDGRVEPDQALKIVGAVCDALEYAHEEGVIHRDIKPENILLDMRGRVKIADFGLAKLLGGEGGTGSTNLTLHSPHRLMGTPHYMAPEQVQRPVEVDQRADIYSVGVVFYEMLTGELPIGRFPLPSELGRGTPAVDEVVIRTLHADPNRRFQRASEIKTAVDSALTQVPPPAAPPAREPVPGAPVPQRPSGVPAAIDVTDAFRRVRTPANLLLASAICALISTNLLGIVTILAAIKMKQLESRKLAIAGAVLALIPLSVCFPLGIFAGAWALWVLTRPEIAEAFEVVGRARAGAAFTAAR